MMSWVQMYKTDVGEMYLVSTAPQGKSFSVKKNQQVGTAVPETQGSEIIVGLAKLRAAFKGTSAPTQESEPQQAKSKKHAEALVEQLDKVATGLQADGNLDLAKAVDWISDIIENKVQ